MLPLNVLRRIVSGQKKRFQDGPDGFDLDLAYIAPRCIAMGLPAVQGKEVLYRNPVQEITRFLQTYHRGHAKVYNLCSEHTYSSQQLPVALQHYPFDDHQTPPLAMVQQFCADAAAWLAADPANVVLVHCKAGKGRTGIMICCLLLYLHKNAPDLANLKPSAAAAAGVQPATLLRHATSAPAGVAAEQLAAAGAAGACEAGGAFATQQLSSSSSSSSGRLWHPWQLVAPVQLRQLEQPVRDVLDLYAERRTHDGNGVTIKSQRRWVGYFWAVLCSSPGPVGMLPKPRSVQLRQVTISGLPPGTADSCVLLVEARPSGSLAASPTRVCARFAPRALQGGVAGACMVPCAHAPLVSDGSCSIRTGPAGDCLTFSMPAASMGLSNMREQPAAGSPAQDRSASGGTGHDSCQRTGAAGVPGCCVCCGAAVGSGCGCPADQQLLPGEVPVTPAGSAGAAWRGGGCSAVLPDEAWDMSEQAGCCVVEGDVRLVVLRGSTRLCYTWFNTAFLPDSGCCSLARAQLDKPSKSLPQELTLSVRYVDMQPAVEAEEVVQLLGQQQQRGWQSSWQTFQEPPLETSGKGSKKPVQPQKRQAKQGPQQQQQLGGAYSIVAAGTAVAPAAGCAVHSGGSDGHVRSSSAEACLAQVQQQQQPSRPNSAGSQAAVQQVSSSAPASPQGRKLRSSGSWRQHLPAISSLSTSALLWGPAAAAAAGDEGCGDQQQRKVGPQGPCSKRGSPSSWCGSAGLNWDWDTLAATCAADDADASRASLPTYGSSSGSSAATNPAAAGIVTFAGSSSRAGSSSVRQARTSSSSGSMLQDLHSSAGVRCNGPAVVSCGLPASHAAIELPVIVKRPSGVDSLVDALLDPEHSAASQTSTAAAAAAAAAASGMLLASEASSSAVAAHSAAAGGKPPGQLRKGYSWHGSSAWFAAMAGSSSSSSAAARPSTSTRPRAGAQLQQADIVCNGLHDVDAPLGLAAGEASVLDLDPLLLSERSGEVPGSLLSSCDPLQGLLEALNWSTDVQRYQSPDQHSCQGRGRSSSRGAGRRGSSSEPCSPRRGSSLPSVLSTPLLHSCRSAPATPEQSASPAGTHASGPCPAQAAAAGPAARPGVRAQDSRWRGSSSSSSHGLRRSRLPRAEVCRLLDLEDWAEDDTEGLDGGEQAGAPPQQQQVDADSMPAARAGLAPADASGLVRSQAAAAVVQQHVRQHSTDAAAAADVVVVADQRGFTSGSPAKGLAISGHRGAAAVTGFSSSSTVARGGGSRAGVRWGVRDEARTGLLAADGPVAPSCAAEAPAVLQQWQQLEKAWHKSWWV